MASNVILIAELSAALYAQREGTDAEQQIDSATVRLLAVIAEFEVDFERPASGVVCASFPDAWTALQAASSMQERLGSPGAPAALRIGIGDETALAHARAGEVLVTNEAIEQIDPEQRSGLVLRECEPRRGARPSLHEFVWATEATSPIQPADRPQSRLLLAEGGRDWSLGASIPRLQLGRDVDSEIQLSTQRASRRHAVLEYRAGKALLTDESLNGTELHRDARPVVLVHRETVVLEGTGVLRPSGASEVSIQFREELRDADGNWRATDTAAAPAAEGPQNAISREGDLWAIRFDGETVRVGDSKGLHALRRLMAAPGDEIPALDLVRDATDADAPRWSEAPTRASLDDAGAVPRMDERAKHEYRRRMATLEEHLAEAESLQELSRAEAVRTEIAALREEVAAGLGIGGRNRVVGSVSERARVTVTQRIRTAVDRIAKANPALGDHLDRSIRTGRLCAYLPDRPIIWDQSKA